MLPVTVLCCIAVVVSTSPTWAQPTTDGVDDSWDSKTTYGILNEMQSHIRDLQNFMLTKFDEIDARMNEARREQQDDEMQSHIRDLQNFMLTEFDEIDARMKVTCPSNFTREPSVNGCYMIIPRSVPWEDAVSECRSIRRDAHLVAINSAEEQLAIANLTSLFDPKNNPCFWTAGQRSVPSTNTTFVWKVQRLRSFARFRNSDADTIHLPMTYTFWNKGEPNNKNGESCLEFCGHTAWKWNDNSCSDRHYPLCEIDL
jgi:hypothetical protein